MPRDRRGVVGTLVVLLLALACGGDGPPVPDRVFLITLDTLRADHLGLYGYPRTTSPFLDALGARSLVFDAAFASCSHTAPSHASLMTGLHPIQHRLRENGETLPESVLTLAQLLRDRGYRTGAFTTVSFLQGLEAGFDMFNADRRFYPAAEIAGRALAWIREQPDDAPLFVWLHLYDVHQWMKDDQIDHDAWREVRATGPQSEAFVDHLRRDHGTDLDYHRRQGWVLEAIERYDGQIRSVDRALERFFSTLEAEGLGGEGLGGAASGGGLWIVTSDHGEGLGNHQYLGHGKTVYAEQIRVPLLIHFTDGRFAPRRLGGLTQLVDVPLTVAELVGASFDAQVVPPAGRSLLPFLANPASPWPTRAIFAERRPADAKRLDEGWLPGEVFALQSHRFKVIAATEGPDEIYDLESDPFELDNLSAAERGRAPPDAARRLLEGLLRRYGVMAAQGEHLGDGEIRPEYIEELRALGYL